MLRTVTDHFSDPGRPISRVCVCAYNVHKLLHKLDKTQKSEGQCHRSEFKENFAKVVGTTLSDGSVVQNVN